MDKYMFSIKNYEVQYKSEGIAGQKPNASRIT